MEIFIVGLTKLIRMNVRLQNPPNFATTMSLARTFEKRQTLMQNGVVRNNSSTWMGNKQYALSSFTLLQNQNTNTLIMSACSHNSSTQDPMVKRLIKGEIANRSAKRLCYNCNEPYTASH